VLWAVVVTVEGVRPQRYHVGEVLDRLRIDGAPILDAVVHIVLHPNGGGRTDVPCYSTDMAAAWQLFEAAPKEHRFIARQCDRWEVHLTGLIAGQRHGDFDSIVTADTAPLAICRAFLIANTYRHAATASRSQATPAFPL
jgi:hypothetical protein